LVSWLEAAEVRKDAGVVAAVEMAVDDAEAGIAGGDGGGKPAGQVNFGGDGDLAVLVDADFLDVAFGAEGRCWSAQGGTY